MAVTKQTAFRIPETTLEHLDDMAKIFGSSRTAFVCMLIEQSYEQMKGNPKMQKVLEAINECTEIMRNAGLDINTPVKVALDSLGALDESESR